MHRSLLILFVAIVLFTGCKEEGEIPSYIQLEEFHLNTTTGQGSEAHKITDAWVFANGLSIGAFQLPATVPIIAEGPTELEIFGVIKENGINSISTMYPFYSPYSATIDLKPMETKSLDLDITYDDDVIFEIVEDFEGSHFFQSDLDGDDSTKIVLSTEDAFEGNSSGLIVVNEENTILEAGWDEPAFFSPVQSELTWVELHYKNNIPFIVGIRGVKDGVATKVYDSVINRKEEWNKIYFNISSIVEPGIFDAVQLVIVAFWTEDLGVEEGIIRIDNVKLLRRT